MYVERNVTYIIDRFEEHDEIRKHVSIRTTTFVNDCWLENGKSEQLYDVHRSRADLPSTAKLMDYGINRSLLIPHASFL